MARILVHPQTARAKHVLDAMRGHACRADLTPAALWAVDWAFQSLDRQHRVAALIRAMQPHNTDAAIIADVLDADASAEQEALVSVNNKPSDSVAARVAVFLRQLHAADPRVIPTLCFRPEAPTVAGACVSCAEPLDGDGTFSRCALCGEAARRAFAVLRAVGGPQRETHDRLAAAPRPRGRPSAVPGRAARITDSTLDPPDRRSRAAGSDA